MDEWAETIVNAFQTAFTQCHNSIINIIDQAYLKILKNMRRPGHTQPEAYKPWDGSQASDIRIG